MCLCDQSSVKTMWPEDDNLQKSNRVEYNMQRNTRKEFYACKDHGTVWTHAIA